MAPLVNEFDANLAAQPPDHVALLTRSLLTRDQQNEPIRHFPAINKQSRAALCDVCDHAVARQRTRIRLESCKPIDGLALMLAALVEHGLLPNKSMAPSGVIPQLKSWAKNTRSNWIQFELH